MGDKRKKSRKQKNNHWRSRAPAIAAILVCAVIVIAAVEYFLSSSSGDGTGGSGTSIDEMQAAADTSVSSGAEDEAASEEDAETEEETEEPLPEIENTSSLTLSSVYTSSILNPDCQGEYAEEVASLEVTNTSDRYLLSAALTATMSDGTEVQFLVSDVPSGATAEIFDTANQSLASGVTCTTLVCTSEEYLDGDMLLSDTIEITADGSSAILINTGSSDLAELTVVYHCDMAGQYFGGTSYVTTIESLAAGESWELSDDTLMGEVTVVRVYQ